MAFLCFSRFAEAQEYKAPLSERAVLNSNKAVSERGASNFRIGPVDFAVSAGLSQQYVDNIGLSERDTEDDFITAPSLGLGASWSFSQLNSFYSSFGLSFSKYWFHPELDTNAVEISPNSRADFDFYVGEVHFRVYDSISIQQEATTISQLSGVTTFRRLSNVCGLDADWDLNIINLTAGYSYNRFVTLEDRFSSLDNGAHNFKDSASVKLAEVWTMGLSSNFGFMDYDDETVQNSGYTYGVGIFSNHTLTQYLRANLAVAYTAHIFEDGGSINDDTNFGAITYSFALHNQLNRWLTHSLEFRRFVELGIGSNFSDVQALSYQASVELIRNVSTTGSLSYQWIEDSKSATAENANHLTLSVRMGYQLTASNTIGLSYTRTMKDSDRVGSDYEQNRVSIDVSHQF